MASQLTNCSAWLPEWVSHALLSVPMATESLTTFANGRPYRWNCVEPAGSAVLSFVYAWRTRWMRSREARPQELDMF
ncbi:hypothetical protein GS532_22320 [Rhodococcus hoagii]|nr:hypothetical protein [Prescottella equi]